MGEIKNIWFEEDRIFMRTSQNELFSRPLEAFPLLKDADEEERYNFRIGKFGDDVRWESLDEDIHISSFFERKEPQNTPIGEIFARYPQINVSAFAKQIGIDKSLLAKYIYGINIPCEKQKNEIRNGLRELAEQLLQVEFVAGGISTADTI